MSKIDNKNVEIIKKFWRSVTSLQLDLSNIIYFNFDDSFLEKWPEIIIILTREAFAQKMWLKEHPGLLNTEYGRELGQINALIELYTKQRPPIMDFDLFKAEINELQKDLFFQMNL